MKKYLKYILAITIALIHIVPIYLLVNVAFKSPDDMTSKWLLPNYLYLDNFKDAWHKANLGKAIFNNMTITFGAIALVVLIGACAAYPLARYKTKVNNFVYTLFVSCMIVPALTILVPLYKFIVEIDGTNTYWGIILILVTFQLPLCIFLFSGFINTIPKELDEAALIDGCSRFQIFFRIILPLLKPVTSTVIILTGVAIWNDYQFSVFFLQKKAMRTISVALSMFFSQFRSNISLVAAGCIMGALPITVVYLLLQKYFIKGIADGAVKG